jgi:hypothetical protein
LRIGPDGSVMCAVIVHGCNDEVVKGAHAKAENRFFFASIPLSRGIVNIGNPS